MKALLYGDDALKIDFGGLSGNIHGQVDNGS